MKENLLDVLINLFQDGMDDDAQIDLAGDPIPSKWLAASLRYCSWARIARAWEVLSLQR